VPDPARLPPRALLAPRGRWTSGEAATVGVDGDVVAGARPMSDTAGGPDCRRAPQPRRDGEIAVLTRIDHVGIAVPSLSEAVPRYEAAFNLKCVHQEQNDRQGVREAMLLVHAGDTGGSYVQLLEPIRDDSPIGKFLVKRGPGIHHIAYGVADIDAALTALATTGFDLVNKTPVHGTSGSRIAFIHPKGLGGVLTELVEAAAGH
jgi:methylmalonyl-CoA/ethylmalonyl-CoA epimerase